MSRKITSFLTMLVMLFVSVNASAQAVDATEFEGKSVTIGGAVTTVETSTWYIVFNGTRANEMGAFVNKDELPGAGGVLYDNGTSTALKKNVTDIKSDTKATQYLNYFVRFSDASGDGESDVYQIQFATGNYLASNLATATTKYDGAKFNFYPVAGNQNGHFGFNLYNMGNLVNNNGVNATLAYWKSGQITEDDYETLKTADTYNSVWSIHPVILNDIDPEDEAWQYATSVIEGENGYRAKMNEMKENVGTFPGQYDPAAVQALADAIDEYDELGNNPDYTIQGIYDAVEKIKNAYEAAVASKVPVTLADGYYRIKSGLAFYKEETVLDPETGEPMIDPETGNEKKETVYYDKYMYSQESGGSIAGKWGTPADLSTDATALWKITNKDGYFDIVNMGTDARFNNVARSTNITMSKETENLIALDPALNVQTPTGVTTYVNVRVSTQNGGDGLYIHPGGHGGGTGTGGNLVGWYTTVEGTNVAGSEWLFLPVSDEEAQAVIDAYAPIKNHDVMVAQCKEMIADAKSKIVIAQDDKRVELITDVSQITFVKTDPSEGTEAGIMDNDPATFWHSDWHDKTSYGKPSLTIQLAEPIQNFTWSILRRKSSNDHVTKCNILAGNNADELSVVIADQVIGNPGNGNKFETAIDLGAAYSVVKFEFTDTDVDSRRVTDPEDGSKLVYAHFAEFHMIQIQANPNSQYVAMGSIATDLEAAITSVEGTEDANITVDQYNALKAAYEAFIEKFVDPAPLRAILKETQSTAELVVTGTDPGFWSEGSDAGSFSALWNSASTYDLNGAYTPAQSEQYIEQLSQGAENIFASANSVQEGKWYKIRFASLEDFETHEWDKIAGNGTQNNNGVVTNESMFGKYVTVSYIENDQDNIAHVQPWVTQDVDKFGLHANLYFDDIDDIEDEDLSMFRFINVGDTAYIMQNKATGLFLKSGTTGATILSPHPSLYNTRALGYGLNAITAESITGEVQNYLHGQVSQNVLVTWGPGFTPYLGSRSSLYIEEVEPVAGDYEGNEFFITMTPGEIVPLCFPVEVSVKDGENATMWSVSSVDFEDVSITLCPIETAEGGHPFFLVCGEADDYDPDAGSENDEVVTMIHGYDITALEPHNASALKGSYYGETVGGGVMIAEGNTFVISKQSSTAVGINSAYIADEEPISGDWEQEIEISWDGTEDGITEAIAKVAKSGAVYTLDGRLVSKNANLNSLKGFGKGIYILNGVKVVVK